LVNAATLVGYGGGSGSGGSSGGSQSGEDPYRDPSSGIEALREGTSSSEPASLLTLSIETYRPYVLDPATGFPAESFRLGSAIGFAVTAAMNEQPISDVTIHCVVRGASGAVVWEGDLTPGENGRAWGLLTQYASAGGEGMYSVEATVTKGWSTTKQAKEFEVTRGTRQR
jgi:hypothetical protein